MKRLANLVEVFAFLSMIVVFAGFFGKWHFLLDLGSHFRIQAAGTILIAGIFLRLLKRRRWALVSLVVGLGLTASLWPFLRPGSTATPHSYRLFSMNVLTNNPRRDLVIDYIVKCDPDFIVLQETSSPWIELLDEALSPSWPYYKSIPRSDNFGIAMYSKFAWISCEVVEYSATLPTPSLSALFHLPGGPELRLITTHPLPPMNHRQWKSRNSHFAELAADIKAAGYKRTIVAGDLNCSPWSYWFGRLSQESGLRNSADGQGLNITWMPIPIPACGLPIDHVLVGPKIKVSQRTVGPYAGSDHRPVIVDFQ
jgi:endonuclease/exonuclease/phosphatase (EEP) superfamily protein YafD